MKQDWRRGILYVSAIGVEGCWLYALMALLNRQVAEERLSIIGILLLYPLAFGCNMVLRWLGWHRVFTRSLSWLAWAVGMLLIVKVQLFTDLAFSDTTWLLAVPRAVAEVVYTFKPELLIVISSGVIWWLGRRLSYLRVDFASLVSEFQFGLFMLAVAFLAASLLEVNLGSSVSIALSFFLFALLGISVAHALEGTSWLSGLYQGHWAGLLLVSIGLILILGLLISLVVTPDLLQLFLIAIRWVWGLIMRVVAFLFSLFPEPGPVEPPPAMPMPGVEPSEGFKLWTMPVLVQSGLRIGWTVMVVGFLLFALWRVSSSIFGWLRRRLAGMAGAEFEPLPGAFRADFLGLLRRILLRLLGLKLPVRLRASAEPLAPEVVSVRQVYRRFLRWAADGGYPRLISQTPHEYSYGLAYLLPEVRDDLDLITQQYVRTRYGTSLPTEYELNQLGQSWHRVRQYHLKDRREE